MHDVTSYLKELSQIESKQTKGLSAEERIKRSVKLRQLIPEPVLNHYDRFVKAGKTPVASVRGGVCQGCYVRLSSGALQKLMRQDDLNLCENCGRYIYPEEPTCQKMEAAAATKPAGRCRIKVA